MMRINPRLLPVTIIVAIIVLSVRASDIWVTLTTGEEPPTIQRAQAQTELPQGDMPANSGEIDASEATRDAGLDGPRTQVRGEEVLTPAMIESLVQRRRDLQVRERELDEREAFLVIAEKRVDDKLVELRQLKADLVQLMDQLDEDRRAQVESLVKIYEAMKPKDAARILENLDRDVLLDVVENMRENKIAPILAEMNADIAQEVTAALARRRQLPDRSPEG